MQFVKWTLPLFALSVGLFGTERGWNSLELAKVYFHNSEIQRGYAWRLLRQVSFEGSERVLDFGCGDGKITAELSCLVPRGSVVGIDLSSSMIWLAKTHFPKTLYENLEFRQIGQNHFDEISGLFDVICAFSVFHFVDQPLDILINLRAHLKKDGRLLLTIPVPPASVMRQAADEMFLKYDLNPPWHHTAYSSKLSMRSIEGCRQRLLDAGYEIFMMQKVDSPIIFHDFSESVDWFVGTASANWGIPFALARPFFTDVLNRTIELDSKILDEEGCLSFPDFNIQVIARPSISSQCIP